MEERICRGGDLLKGNFFWTGEKEGGAGPAGRNNPSKK